MAELIERQSPELAGALALRRVSISKRTGEMCVQLCADRLFKREEYKRVHQALSAAFPAVGVRLKLTYPRSGARRAGHLLCHAAFDRTRPP